MNKRILAIVAICIIIPFTLGARSLYDVSLGFGGKYTPSSDEGFFSEMNDLSDWGFGGELSMRISFLQAQVMAYPMQCDDDGQGILLIGFAGIDTPIVGDLLQLELGIGTSVLYVIPEDSSAESYYELADRSAASTADTTFGQAAIGSPMYLMAGIGTDVGTVGVHVRYLMQSTSTLESLTESGRWWQLLDQAEGSFSLALSLKMF